MSVGASGSRDKTPMRSAGRKKSLPKSTPRLVHRAKSVTASATAGPFLPKTFFVWMFLCNLASACWQTLYYAGFVSDMIVPEVVIATIKMLLETVYGDLRTDRLDLIAHHIVFYLAAILCLRWWTPFGLDGSAYTPAFVHGLCIHYAMVFASIRKICAFAPPQSEDGTWVTRTLQDLFPTAEERRQLDTVCCRVLLAVWLPIASWRSLGLFFEGCGFDVFSSSATRGQASEWLLLLFGVVFLVLDLKWTRWDLYRDVLFGKVVRRSIYPGRWWRP
ncbi:unnamed protein product [Amoebophrya sp. A25]|nr:unnamed protein product [Amoebophrya sp. A25]|eukprot:GSA25T00003223001.1